MKVLVFGDSIVRGAYLPKGSWVQRIASQHLESSGGEVEIVNLGAGGDTLQGLIGRLVSDVKVHNPKPTETVLVVAIGTNDSLFRKGVEDTHYDDFVQNLPKLLALAKSVTQKVLFVGFTGVDEANCMPLADSSTGKCYSNERLGWFEQALQTFCAINGVPMVPVHEAFRAEQAKRQLVVGGLHPNNAGQDLIASLVKPVLEKLL
ncbi:MAG TPA: SGNH/GDSL hydrolase family protein [Methylococcales bacterium]